MSIKSPNMAYRSRGVRSKRSESKPNGIVTGRAARILIGWIQLSNCAARIKYIKVMLRIRATAK
jgi:hypothetical protein